MGEVGDEGWDLNILESEITSPPYLDLMVWLSEVMMACSKFKKESWLCWLFSLEGCCE